MTKRKTYSKAFKIEAVRQLESGEIPAEQLARELGVRRVLLYRWQKDLEEKGEHAFLNNPGPKPRTDAELAKLRAENKRLQEEVGILKKAAVDSIGQCNRYPQYIDFEEISDEAVIYDRRAGTCFQLMEERLRL